MKLSRILVILVLIALGGQQAQERGLLKRWFGKQPEQIDGEAALEELLASINLRRSTLGLDPLAHDTEVDEWIGDEAAAVVPSEEVIGRFLHNLQQHLPGVKVAKANYAENSDAVELLASLKDWVEVTTDPKLTHLSVHVFPRSSWKVFRVAAVAVRKLPRFDPQLLGLGHRQTEVYNICPQCGNAHISTLDRRGLAIVLHCDRCEQDYDIYAMKLDGSYVRVTDLLRGYEATAAFNDEVSPFDQMMAIWGAVLSDFTYTTDLEGSRGPQDTWQTASETASFRNGDCEDTSIFMADWLISRGIDARVAFGFDGTGSGHAWCVARVDGEEYILESTAGKPDPDNPPLTNEAGHGYLPIALFDREHIYFRINGGWTPRYWSDQEWRSVSFRDEAKESLTPPSLGELEIGSQFFGHNRIAAQNLAAASGAAAN